MTLFGMLTLLIIAGLSGFIASQLMGAKRMNIALMVILGFVGAWVGQHLAGLLKLPPLLVINTGGQTFPLAWAIIGSILVVGIAASINQHN